MLGGKKQQKEPPAKSGGQKIFKSTYNRNIINPLHALISSYVGMYGAAIIAKKIKPQNSHHQALLLQYQRNEGRRKE